MKRFTELYIEMDRTTRTSEKLAAMVRYFKDVSPLDAAWGLYFLSGRKLKRLTNWRILNEAIVAETGLPEWLIAACYEAVGDSAEMMALLHPHEPQAILDQPLHEVVEQRLLPLRDMAEPSRQSEAIRQHWRVMSREQRLVFNKLLTGAFRVGVAQTSIIKALAEFAAVSPAVMSHRFAGSWQPTADGFRTLIEGSTAVAGEDHQPDPAQPYPFLLGYPLELAPEGLGPLSDWLVEWKYDGFRAQFIRRRDTIILWSRGEEMITPAFPELVTAAGQFPEGTVLDGEIVAWDVDADQPLPFAMLQRRINRKKVEQTLFPDVPVMYLAFDILEHRGKDVREAPLDERREMLARLFDAIPTDARSVMRLSPKIEANTWQHVAQMRDDARQRQVEGVMIKRRASKYEVGRRKGDWWKWKVDPYTVDAVLIYAQGGSGRRSGLFTDYTFGVWDDSAAPRELVPVAKAYSGLTDDEIRLVDRFIRANTISKAGPVRIVRPELVFELAFEGIAESDRHRSKIALRFPRMHRWRTDKKPDEADTLAMLQALLANHTQTQRGSPRGQQSGRRAN